MVERKAYDERMEELLKVSGRLFMEKGYDKTTINDILEAVGIGKGTFYYYFKSKDAVMDAVIQDYVEKFAEAARKVADNPALNAHEKFKKIITEVQGEIDDSEWFFSINQIDNARLYQKTMLEITPILSPILTRVVEEAIRDGIYHVKYPKETVEMILAINQSIFDRSVLQTNTEKASRIVAAFVHNLELLLGAKENSFAYLNDSVKEQLEREKNEN